MSVLTGCVPRDEVLHGDLDDAIFAAEFGDVIEGSARPVYQDPAAFFRNTYPTTQLKSVVKAVFDRLNNPHEPGVVLRLSTGYGGGKTHALITLWHLARHVTDLALAADLLPAASRPSHVSVAAVDAQSAGPRVFGRHGGLEVGSLWGELAFSLGGESAWRSLSKDDRAESGPDTALFRSILPEGPVLFLIDELVIYISKLTELGRKNVLGFLGQLASIASSRPQTVLVVTDTARQSAYMAEASQIANELRATTANDLEDLIGRRAGSYDPIGAESTRVIARRLFQSVSETARQRASQVYRDLYDRVSRDQGVTLPERAATHDYATSVADCYPFHPRLLETARERLATMARFQQTRGVLRLFGRILRDVWDAQADLELITAGDIDWSSPRIQADLLDRLDRGALKAAVAADIERHAGELDAGSSGVHRRAASALLLESLPLDSNAGLTEPEMTLTILRPEEAGQEPGEALQRLSGVCWHTFPMEGGRGYQFRIEENVNRRLEQRAAEILLEDARARVHAEVQQHFAGSFFKLAPWPRDAQDATERPEIQLALCESVDLAIRVCKYSDERDPAAPIPRGNINAIVAIAPTPAQLEDAIRRARMLLAADKLKQEYGSAAQHRTSREQLDRIHPDLRKQLRVEAARAFSTVVLASGPAGRLEEVHFGGADSILGGSSGQEGLKRFLTEKDLIYGPDDALDPPILLRILQGATLTPGKGYSTRAVYERLLSAPGLHLIADSDIVRRSLRRALDAGKIVLHTAEGTAYDHRGAVRGAEEHRIRIAEGAPPIPIDTDTWIALADDDLAKEWLRETVKGPEGGPPPGPGDPGPPGGGPWPPPGPPAPADQVATTWDDTIRLSHSAPLKRLTLTAQTPADGDVLLRAAQPLGAPTTVISVTVEGELVTGGRARYQVAGAKANSPVQPVQTARTLFNALVEDGLYEYAVEMDFGEGSAEMNARLERSRGQAPPGAAVRAVFGPRIV